MVLFVRGAESLQAAGRKTRTASIYMAVAVITGSAGLIGSEASKFFANLGFEVAGIDNDMRQVFFGEDASTKATRERLQEALGKRYIHYDSDMRQYDDVQGIFPKYKSDVDRPVAP